MEIKEVIKDDYKRAQELYCLCFDKDIEDISLNFLGDFIGVYIDNRLIGIAQIDYLNNVLENKRIAFINSFCIHPSYRNKGIGTRLLNKCIDICNNNGCNYINLTSNSNRTVANILYLNNGFKRVDTNIFKKDIL